jgi:flavin-dependent dehydrogenase
MFENAVPDEDDVFSYKNLIYRSDRIAGNRWVIVGDAAGFMDPLYSHGLDFCAHTVSAATEMILREVLCAAFAVMECDGAIIDMDNLYRA